MRHKSVLSFLLLSFLAGPVLAADKIEFSDEAVEKAIEKGKAYLWSQFNAKEGHWKELTDAPDQSLTGLNYGGLSALITYALLASGESAADARMKQTLEWQNKLECVGTYALGLRCQIWYILKSTGRNALARDAKQLVESVCRPKALPPINDTAWARYGTYTYSSAGKAGPGGDHSNTQYGILGVWAAARANIEVPRGYWELVYTHFGLVQNKDGGWSYSPVFGGEAGSTGSMTAAGLASSYVAFDNLFAEQFVKCGANPDVPILRRGLEWFDKNFAITASDSQYYMYGVERIGLASGYKYFGNKDWYKLTASVLINSQREDGSWYPQGYVGGATGATAYALLFLVRGRNPVLFNRLEYDGDWNNRPRALANLTHWISKTFEEQEVNWQIITLKAPVEEWHDAPILLITGSKAPKFADADLDKLRAYVQQGGMIFSVAECGPQGGPFDLGMREVYKKLFPEYELSPLPADHPVYKLYFPVRRVIPISTVSNGVRPLVLHTADDVVLPWQTNAQATGVDNFNLAFNIFRFASDKGPLRYRGTTLWPEEKSFTPLRTAKLARVKYNGNWNPEPLAWKHFALILGQKWQTKVMIGDPLPAEQLKADDYRVAVVTGTGAPDFSDAQKKALKAYVEAGGTLIFDAAGGSAKFADSAVALVEGLFGRDSLAYLPTTSPVLQMPGLEMKSVRYRRALREKIGDVRTPRVMAATVNGRPAVFVSREDLTAGLVGFPCFTCMGYEPQSAMEIMRNLVLYAMKAEKDGGDSATQPTGG